MSSVTFQRGVTLASCMAGPILVTPPTLVIWANDPTLSLNGLGLFPAINFFALIIGLF